MLPPSRFIRDSAPKHILNRYRTEMSRLPHNTTTSAKSSEQGRAEIDASTRRASSVGFERHGLPKLINSDLSVEELPLATPKQNVVGLQTATKTLKEHVGNSGRFLHGGSVTTKATTSSKKRKATTSMDNDSEKPNKISKKSTKESENNTQKTSNASSAALTRTRPQKRKPTAQTPVPRRQKVTRAPITQKTASVANRKTFSSHNYQNILSGFSKTQCAESKTKIDAILENSPPLYFSDHFIPTLHPRNKVLSQPICPHASLFTQRTVFFGKARDSLCETCEGTGSDELFVHKGQVVRPGQYLRGRRGGVAPGKRGIQCTDCGGKGVKKEAVGRLQIVDTAGWKVWTVNDGGQTGSVCGCRMWNDWENSKKTQEEVCMDLADEVAKQAYEYEGVRINTVRAWREMMILLHVQKAEDHFHR